MKPFRITLAVAVLILAAVATVEFALSGPPEVPPLAAPEVAAAAPSAPQAPAPSRPQPKSPAPAEAVIPALLAAPDKPLLPEDDGEHGEFTTSTDILKQRLFKREPKLAQFDYFREHVLLDSVSRESYRKLLLDKEMLAQTRDDLLHPKDAKDTTETNVKRLMQIDYLREGMNWKENPEAEHLLATVESIILEDSFTDQMNPGVKRSIAATKMELYELLSNRDPARALALVEKARGTRLEKMLQYFAEHNQRRLAKERELSLQAQTSNPKP
ncbi:hypothetical protein [Stigmatella aurantiaca]|uniref:Uncharacterized protein n=1 Tax=Stigmatella aurantiaca (strain DW4/3-1) TaxID=378806 RepID=Q093N9_STIAD|nr:hypothetical protein [Stigmatella aurantiaca]ADO72734.1 uncharacterized protein STAUR_4956 [Stigmatella aurantiaca DW4/3-1]EAU66929.1 hypothetical protein STIAU_0057 [Stigmatella aurantiaca DW4/3-1]